MSDERHLPYGVSVAQWVEENRWLQRQMAATIERALASPDGVSTGHSLSETIAHARHEEQRYGARVAYWEQRQAAARAAHEAAWHREREAFGFEPLAGYMDAPPPPFEDPTATLYRFYDAAGVLLYIGQTVRAYERIRQHTSGKQWFPEVASIRLQRVPAAQVLTLEAEAIRTERPRHNIAHQGRRP